MCRFISYIGNPLVLDEILFKPHNSLINQSRHAREMKVPLNGDGFGLGWYAPEIDSYPALFKSIQPAWNNQNLNYLASKIRSNCFFAHIRSATRGNVSPSNSHPFHYKQLLFMHNGDIGGFNHIKRSLREQLSDEFYDYIQGQTDSEHFFALFLDKLQKNQMAFNAQNGAKILIETIEYIESIKKSFMIVENSYINAVITDGNNMVGIRYISNPTDKPLSMYYTTGSKYECRNGRCYIHPSPMSQNQLVLITSERLNDDEHIWHEIPSNHLLLVDNGLSTSLCSLSGLQ